MSGINKVILVGNLGADPEVRYMQNGDAVANLRVATSERWKDRNTGEPVERTEWHRVVMFRRLAEIAQQYLHKGSRIYVEGKLTTRKWQAQDGSERYTTEIHVNEMQMLDGRQDQAGQGGFQGTAPQEPVSQTRNQPVGGPAATPREQDFDDDIPF